MKKVKEITSRLEYKNDGNSKEYKIEAICNDKIYVKEFNSGYHLPNFHYLGS